jgi:hypothetical protein
MHKNIHYGGQDSVVGIATRSRLETPGFQPRWAPDLPGPFIHAPNSTKPPITTGTCSRCVVLATSFSAKVYYACRYTI